MDTQKQENTLKQTLKEKRLKLASLLARMAAEKRLKKRQEKKIAGAIKAQKEYDSELADIDQRIVDAKKAKQNKLNKLNRSAELFGDVPKNTEIFGQAQDLSKENIDRQMQPFNDVILNIEKEKQEFIDNKDLFLKKYDTQVEIPI